MPLSKSMSKVWPVILAGGSGSRLWPLSRSRYPKQFLALDSDETLLQSTLKRANACSSQAPLILCNEEHRFLAAEQLLVQGELNSEILLEPCARNTAPAIAAAAWRIHAVNPEGLMLVMPADHLISDEKRFADLIERAIPSAVERQLVTFGINPSYPATGYGYIRAEEAPTSSVQKIISFEEKPDIESARSYVSDGSYLWNAGIFLFRVDVFLEELKKFEPEIHSHSKLAVEGAKSDLDFLRLDTEEFAKCPSISVDYAVMEKASNRSVMAFDLDWSDIGSWNALYDVAVKDDSGNVVRGDAKLINSKNSFVRAESRLVTAVGLDNIAIVETSDSVLVTNLQDSENVKLVVEALKVEKRSEVDFHKVVYRPWGSYESIATGDRFQVKRIIVKPGAALSLQKHHHRSEHWVVAHGTAVITIDDSVVQLSENESTYIPLGAVHRLENPGKIPLILIEVQSGSYLGEDDIVRLEDVYGRG